MTLPDKLTYGAMLDLLTRCATEPEAGALFSALVDRSMAEGGHDRETAERMTRSNIGYLGGYCGVDVQARLERLFGAVHPVFGAVGSPESPKSPEEAFARGVRIGRST